MPSSLDTAHLRPEFDPNSVRVAELRGILVEHLVPYSSTAKKADLVELYEREIRPKAHKILAQRERVRASSVGIEDGRQGATSSSSTTAAVPTPSRRSSGMSKSSSSKTIASSSASSSSRKSMSMNNLAGAASAADSEPKSSKGASSRRRSSAVPSAGGRSTRRSASVEILSAAEEDELAAEGDMEESSGRSVKRGASRSKTKKPAQSAALASNLGPAPMDVDEEDEVEVTPVSVSASTAPMSSRRKSALPSPSRPVVEVPMGDKHRRKSMPASSSSEAGQKRKSLSSRVSALEEDARESGFSDYNPFQSGDDASPDASEKKKKRRKSSLGPNVLSAHDDAAPSSIKRSSTMQSLGSSRLSVGDSGSRGPTSPFHSTTYKRSSSRAQLENRDPPSPPPVPSVPAAFLNSERKSGLTSSKSTPSFSRYIAPLDSLATAPEDFKLILKQAEEDQKRSSPDTVSKIRQSVFDSPANVVAGQRVSSRLSQPTSALTDEDEKILESLAAESALPDEVEEEEEEPVTVMSSIVKEEDRRKSPTRRAPPPPKALQEVEEIVVATKAPFEATSSVTTKALVPGSSKSSRSILPSAKAVAYGTLLPLVSLLAGYANFWAAEKQQLGFCDTDITSNRAVIHRRMERSLPPKELTGNPAIDAFLKDAQDTLTPVTCEPCPAHAECENGQVRQCSKDFILQPNAISFLFSDGIDSRKSILPLLFKPSCKPDTEKLIRIVEIEKLVLDYLKRLKGEIICSGEEKARIKANRQAKKGSKDEKRVDEWAVYGASEDWLKKVIAERRNPKISDAAFDELFQEAIQDLIGQNEVVHGVDQEAEPWLASVAADMPLACRTRLAAYNAADEHKTSIAGLLALLLSALYTRVKVAEKKKIKQQVDELVPVALQLLQQQEQNHHIDNVLTPYPYLAPAQLRDLILADIHSPSKRNVLWQRVEKIIESNSNVRAKVEEQFGEDIRVWQWVGGTYELIEDNTPAVLEQEYLPAADDGPYVGGTPAGSASAVRRRKSYGGLGTIGGRSSLSRPGTPRANPVGRHITWSEDVKGSPAHSSVSTPM